jgi:hypothetical protein
MAMMLRKSTASQEVLLGPFVDNVDGDTAETGLTIAASDIKVWKYGATTLANKNSGGATHISNGYYYAVLDATDTDTAGMLEVNVKVSGALAIHREFQVLEADVYDAIYASGAGAAFATKNGLIDSATTTTVTLPTPWNTGLAIKREIFDLTGSQSRWLLAHVGSGVYTLDRSWVAPSASAPFLLGGLMPPGITADGYSDIDPTSLRNAIGLATNNIDSQFGTIMGYIDTEVAAIKAKTDALPAAFPANFASLAITSSTGLVSINVAQTGLAVRDLSSLADNVITVGDCLVAGMALAAGDGSVVGTTYTVKTPAGTSVAVKSLDSATAPTSKI